MMKNGTNRLYISLAALTVFGNSAFALNFSSENGIDFISSALNLIITAVVLFSTMKLAVFLKQKTESFPKKILPLLFCLLAIICLCFAVCSLENLVKICAATMADEIGLGIIILSLILVILALTLSKKRAILKFSLLFFSLVLGLVLLIFFFSYSFMSIKYLELKEAPEISRLLKKTLERFAVGVLPVCLPLAVVCFNKPSSVTFGGTIGATLVLITVANTILIFGSEFASELSYPYAQAVSTVSIGELFSRMDAVLYPVCFFPGIVRTSVQILAAIKLFGKAKNMRKISI